MSDRGVQSRAAAAAAPATAGTIVLLTRLARAVFLRSSVDLVGMNLRNMVTLAYLRDHPGVSQQTMTEDLSMDSNTGVLVLNDLEDLEYAEMAQGSIEDEILGGLSASERAELRRLLVKALEEHQPDGGG